MDKKQIKKLEEIKRQISSYPSDFFLELADICQKNLERKKKKRRKKRRCVVI